MRIHVVSDYQGRIISISKPEEVGHVASGIGAAGIVPEAGQRVHVVELPERLQKRPLLELHQEFRVQVKGDKARLVHAKEIKGPFPVE